MPGNLDGKITGHNTGAITVANIPSYGVSSTTTSNTTVRIFNYSSSGSGAYSLYSVKIGLISGSSFLFIDGILRLDSTRTFIGRISYNGTEGLALHGAATATRFNYRFDTGAPAISGFIGAGQIAVTALKAGDYQLNSIGVLTRTALWSLPWG